MAAEAFNNNTNLIAVYGGCNIIDENDHIVEEIPVPDCSFKTMLHKGYSVIPQPSVFIKRKHLAKQRVVLDEKLNYSTDQDLFKITQEGAALKTNKTCPFFGCMTPAKLWFHPLKCERKAIASAKSMAALRLFWISNC